MSIRAVFCRKRSSGAKVIAAGLDRPRIIGSTSYRGRALRDGSTVLNWGSSVYPVWRKPNQTFINRPEAVATAVSKVRTYAALQAAGVPTIEFTSDVETALGWNRSSSVLARRDGLSGGDGIRIYERRSLSKPVGEEGLFFTRYFPKTHEYRVHVCLRNEVLRQGGGIPNDGVQEGGHVVLPRPDPVRVLDGAEAQRGTQDGTFVHEGSVIDLVQKKRSRREALVPGDGGTMDRTLAQRIVRSHGNGWIFAHNDLYLPDNLRDLLRRAAISAVRAVGLDFGAVDVCVRADRDSRTYDVRVLEVNTAPGLENQTTIDAYLSAFGNY